MSVGSFYKPGTDGELVRWNKIVEYFNYLDALSDRIKVVDLGRSTEGNPMIVAYISSSENLERL
ncbi:MAG: hypothetical protein R6U46_13615, partial [Marinilabilia sp.]